MKRLRIQREKELKPVLMDWFTAMEYLVRSEMQAPYGRVDVMAYDRIGSIIAVEIKAITTMANIYDVFWQASRNTLFATESYIAAPPEFIARIPSKVEIRAEKRIRKTTPSEIGIIEIDGDQCRYVRKSALFDCLIFQETALCGKVSVRDCLISRFITRGNSKYKKNAAQ